jgi:DNA polymerase-3 subunit beta
MEQGKGEGNDEIDVDYKGDAFEAAYNPNYIIDMLKVVNSEEVVFEFSSSINPGVIKPADDANYLYIIMPMRME